MPCFVRVGVVCICRVGTMETIDQLCQALSDAFLFPVLQALLAFALKGAH